MSTASKLKVLAPITYLLLSLLYFYFSLQSSERVLHYYFGIFVTTVAFVFWLIARIQLGNAFSISPKAKYLVTTGIYSKLRHPIYYFSILALLGIAIFSWNGYVLAAVLALITIQLYRIKKEETLLRSVFGREYLSYRQKSWL